MIDDFLSFYLAAVICSSVHCGHLLTVRFILCTYFYRCNTISICGCHITFACMKNIGLNSELFMEAI